MSEVRLLIRDAQREIQAERHGSFAERLVAALGAEPETIEELEAALERFVARSDDRHFCDFGPGDDEPEPYDAGLVVIDLAARLVVCDSSYFSPAREGSVTYDNGTCATDVHLNYHLSDDWLLTEDATDWKAQAEERRCARLVTPRLDARAVLYGEALLEFVGQHVFEAFHNQGPAANPDYQDPAYQCECDLVKGIHIRWLMTPRDDLRGETPRQVMVSRRHFASVSMDDREFQWSLTDQCPPGLDPESAAYRFAGFGTHEMVVYYDLVRELLWRCRHDVAELHGTLDAGGKTNEFVTSEIGRLAEFRDEWLDAPYSESGGRTGRSIIHNERARIPEGESGVEAMIEDDCPLCQMQAEMPGPVFWHLDGSHLGEDFAFSLYHQTREEWEEQRREWDEFDRRFEAKSAEQKRLGVEFPGHGWADPDIVWKSSFSSEQLYGPPLPIRLFAVGSHLAELIVDLKEPPDEASSGEVGASPAQLELADRLNRVFGDLRKGVRSLEDQGEDALTRFVLVDFCDALDAVRAARPDLALKCTDLRDKVQRFLEPPDETNAVPDLLGDDYLPS